MNRTTRRRTPAASGPSRGTSRPAYRPSPPHPSALTKVRSWWRRRRIEIKPRSRPFRVNWLQPSSPPWFKQPECPPASPISYSVFSLFPIMFPIVSNSTDLNGKDATSRVSFTPLEGFEWFHAKILYILYMLKCLVKEKNIYTVSFCLLL